MKKGKGMRFVGDSRINADKTSQVPKDYSEYPGRTEAFWPNFLLKEWLVGSVFLVGFLCATIASPAPLQGLADPSDAVYIPLPDWYFLFLYQLLKYPFASGDFIILGMIVLPGLAFGALFLAPFLDNGPGRRPPQRPIAVGMMLLALISAIWLTYEAAGPVDFKQIAEDNPPVLQADIEIDTEHPGYEAYESSCLSCHGDSLDGGAAGPSLIGIELTEEEIADIAVNGTGDMPPGIFEGSDEEIADLVDFILTVNEDAE